MLKIIIAIVLITPLYSRHFKEKYYQEHFCKNGTMEYGLPDKTRIDCLTEKYAIELDFANKWAEAIGQSLHYSRMSGKEPAIVIIIERGNDLKHIKKILPVAKSYNIKVWTIDCNLNIKTLHYDNYWNKINP